MYTFTTLLPLLIFSRYLFSDESSFFSSRTHNSIDFLFDAGPTFFYSCLQVRPTVATTNMVEIELRCEGDEGRPKEIAPHESEKRSGKETKYTCETKKTCYCRWRCHCDYFDNMFLTRTLTTNVICPVEKLLCPLALSIGQYEIKFERSFNVCIYTKRNMFISDASPKTTQV